VLDRLSPREWHVISCLGTEERCFAALDPLAERNLVGRATLVNILEPEGHPGAAEIKQFKEMRSEELTQPPLKDLIFEFSDHNLLEPYHRIVEATRAAAEGSRHILFDITTLPKRFFFPMLKILLRSEGLEDLVVTYSMAERYVDTELHQDIQSPEFLSLFGPEMGGNTESTTGLVVSIGFESSGVIQILEQSDYSPVTVLFSYPAPPPFFGRNWDFVRYATKSVPHGHLDLQGISVTDVPSVFDVLSTRISSPGASYICAPFGPKPVSLAMCLFCAGRGRDRASVMYTQPKYYNPRYSEGVRRDEQGPVIYAYPIMLTGKNRYD
jgi:hypothetical protein